MLLEVPIRLVLLLRFLSMALPRVSELQSYREAGDRHHLQPPRHQQAYPNLLLVQPGLAGLPVLVAVAEPPHWQLRVSYASRV